LGLSATLNLLEIPKYSELDRYYKKTGWKVVRVWEYDLGKNFEKLNQ